MATNCLGPFLLSRYLRDLQTRTAALESTTPGTVRTVWVSSMLSGASVDDGIAFDDATGAPKVQKNAMDNYMQSKAGAVFMAHESAQRFGESGIINMSVHPGLMKTELQRHKSPIVKHIMGIAFKPAKFGAYSELFAGFSPEVTKEHNGAFAIPWGRFGKLPGHVAKALKTQEEGGTGTSARFWKWCEQETKPFFTES
ncbi:hypothetical protein NLG97_g8352 [Lecanicillium saksenae]|uniref:Uncharacterized protein n=1 Tax=Lecanicillium saksenae TaxID=468837 RepID=A0ACC1QMF1_9HYPO|nr:hypothetical protein NLG97_g8352 [Lecanicillium saksenae]